MAKLSLWQNSVSGTLPHSLGTLGALVSLNLDNNHFEGGLPACLGALPRLRELGLSNNKLGGSIPASFGQLSELTVLFLDDNELIGTMPRELGGAPPPPRMLCTCPAHAFGGTFGGTFYGTSNSCVHTGELDAGAAVRAEAGTQMDPLALAAPFVACPRVSGLGN